ncbi:MAG: Hsp20/alpha crystallin family protein [Candidatus Falkowbacteria bacterium]|nr:Hsp20/alpha crystallin family protein [Candidatus Falkowbacteria bacterium]
MINIFSSKKNHSRESALTPEEQAWPRVIAAEGQLAVDIYQQENRLIVKSTIAGAKAEDLNINLHNDLLTIKGTRELKENIREEYYLCRECYWGPFSRSIILPVEVDSQKIEATLEDGVLTISLLILKNSSISIQEK